jgi:flagellar motor switch protein FliG
MLAKIHSNFSVTFLSLLFFLSIFPLLSNTLHAQTAFDASSNQSLDLRVANLEQQYDSQIIQILSNYFNRKKFFIDVSIYAELVDETVGTTSNQVIESGQQEQNLFMPGLPFLPEQNLRQPANRNREPETIINENTIKTLRIVNMSVNIYADTSVTTAQLELMRFITGIAVKINENRGDEITISQLAIPDYTEAPEPVTATTVTQQPALPDYNSIYTYIPALALMLLFGLTLLFNRLMNKPQPQVPMRDFREAFKNDMALQQQAANPFSNSDVPNNESDTTIEDLTSEDIVNAFFTKPEEIATIFRYWLSEEENGAKKAAEYLVAVDKHLLRTLKKELHPEDYDSLSDAVLEQEIIAPERKAEIVEEFARMLQQGAKQTITEKKRGKFSLFKFLDHISDKHILTLLETEDSISGAFILQYIPDDKAALLLEKLDKEIAAKIMLHMASLNNLTNDQQQKISSELFDKAMDLVEAERSEQYGAEHLYPILERLPVHEQQRYIDELKATGSIVGAILEKQFITIERLPELSDEVIKKAVRTLNTETLLDAIVGLPPQVVDRILSARPTREQRLLRMELDELQGTSGRQTEYAKALLMNSIRKNANDQ